MARAEVTAGTWKGGNRSLLMQDEATDPHLQNSVMMAMIFVALYRVNVPSILADNPLSFGLFSPT